jgi:hypothetical protein
LKSRRFQLVIPNDAFAVLQRLQGVYGGSLSSVVRRAIEMLDAFNETRPAGVSALPAPADDTVPTVEETP